MKKIKITLVSMISTIIPTIAYGQQAQTAIKSSGPIFAEINMQELIGSQNQLVNHVVNLNATYLGICLAAIVALLGLLGGIFYLFNLKPAIEKIDSQNKEIGELKNKLALSIDSFDEKEKNLIEMINRLKTEMLVSTEKSKQAISEKFNVLEKNIKDKFSLLERRADHEALMSAWDAHYLWEPLPSVPVNQLNGLIDVIDKSEAYDKKYNAKNEVFPRLPINKFKEVLRNKETILSQKDKNDLIRCVLESNNISASVKSELSESINDLKK